MHMNKINTPLDLKSLKITDSFWKKEMELVRKEVIPYQWEALNDRVKDAAPSYCMRNFKIAGKMNQEKHRLGKAYEEPKYTFRGFEALPEDPEHLEDKFYGFVFQDSDFSKWIEAVAYSLTQYPDPELEKIADGAIDIVCAAQQDDGYLDTYYIINGKDKIFTNLKDNHELYCFGHLTEGAVAYYQATGKDKLLKAVERFADYIANYFGEEEGKCKGYPGHEIAEMALVRLYEVTGEERYLQLSEFFINQRGTKPYYFDIEQNLKLTEKEKNELRYQYHQAHLPVRQQDEAVGHAVRAVYLYSGMADIARITGDETLYKACETLWDNITNQKMYVTGGIGGTHIGEAFSFPFDLPNDTAYAETCASIGLVFFARRMLEITPKAKYAEIYKDLKRKIETGEFEFQELLPSENTLVQEYDCSRNTIRRAIGDLVADGYVQTMQGKGVRIIFQPALQTSFTIGSIETFTESAKRNNQKSKTKVIHFAELVVDKKIAAKTGFNIGDEIYYLQRLHYLDGKALILNHNYFLKSVAKDLTIEIAEKSIYDYLENTLGVSIVTSKRIMTVEKMTEIDEKYLDLGDYNCMAVVTSHTYNSDGVMFEYTQSRHRPDYFSFQDNATRRSI